MTVPDEKAREEIIITNQYQEIIYDLTASMTPSSQAQKPPAFHETFNPLKETMKKKIKKNKKRLCL
jgi:hypothetical protein